MVGARWCSDLTSQFAACSRSVRYSRSALLRTPPADPGVIPVVDQNPRQCLGVELDDPAALRAAARIRISGITGCGGGASKAVPGSRVERSDLGDHVGEVLGIDPAQLHQRGDVARGEQRQVVEQRPASPGRAGRGRAIAAPGIRRDRARRRRAGQIAAARASTRSTCGDRAAELARPRRDRGADSRPRRADRADAEAISRSAGSRRSAPICSIRCSRRRARTAPRSARCRVSIVATAEPPSRSANNRRRRPRSTSRRRSRRTAASQCSAASPATSPPARRRAASGSVGRGRSPPAPSSLRDRDGASSLCASPRSSSGFCSISASTNSLSSRFDSCSSLIACCSCGVITSAWLCRSSRRCERPILFTKCSVGAGL